MHNWLTDKFIYCCLSEEQQAQLKEDLDGGNYRSAYLFQKNLTKEKTGYRCRICGTVYPFLKVEYQGELIDPKRLSRISGKTEKYRKAAAVFCGDHYYAQSKKSLLKFELDADGKMYQSDEIPIMRGVYHTILSQNESYIATETFQGTISIIHSQTKDAVAIKRGCKINGAFIFAENNQLLYFSQDTIRCWNFMDNTDVTLWVVPEEWKVSQHPVHVVCNNVICNSSEKAYLFQCIAGQARYAVVIKDLCVVKTVQLPEAPTHSKLVYAQGQDMYTFASGNSILCLDKNGQVIEKLACPQVLEISDGGGLFPITRQTKQMPQRVFLSPDGAWLLLDYFTSAILVNRKSQKIHYCLYSHTGKVAQHMGFVNSRFFWYTWGDTTYTQEIAENS